MTSSCEPEADGESPKALFDDDDITIDSPIHEPPPALYQAVARALTLLWGHYDLLIQARAAQRFSGIEMLAEDCVRQWSIAQATMLKLEQVSHEPNGYVTSARVAVDGAGQLLQPELRPMAQLPAQVRKRLVWLRLMLRISMNKRGQGRKTKDAL